MATEWIQDPGHGGSDPGANAKGNIEKEYTLEAGLYVQKRLKELGIASDITRTKDVTLDSTPRANKVSKYKYCISHHYNASGGGADGFEFIHSIYANGQFEHMLLEEFKAAGYKPRPRPIYTRKNDRGTDYYYMHRTTGNCRTTIVEYDFLDGGHSEKVKSLAYRVGMYECVIKAICRQEDKAYKPVVKDEPKSSDGKYHRVQVGAFKDKDGAEALVKKLKKDGYDAILKHY